MAVKDIKLHTSPLYYANFEATFEQVSTVCAEIHALALQRGDVEWAVFIDLGLTEALTNIIRHGYGPDREGRVILTCVEFVNLWLFTLMDCGISIPQAMLRQASDSIFNFDSNDLQSIPEGGMGLALIRACFDSVSYQVYQDGNYLLLTKHFSQSEV